MRAFFATTTSQNPPIIKRVAKAEKDGFYLSLGAGENQLPLIRAAREQGLKIIGVDRNLGAVGLKYCDLKIEESILNYRKIYYKISSLVEPSQIAGGYAASYGDALASFAFLCERLSIIGLSRTLMERARQTAGAQAPHGS